MDRFQQFLNDGWRPEQVPMRLRSRPIEITGSHEDRGESSIRQPHPMKRLPKVGAIPGAYTSPTWRPGDTTRCVCPACDPDDEPGGENVHPAPIATKRRSLAWAQRDAINQAKQRREAPSRAEFAAWMRGVVGERGKS